MRYGLVFEGGGGKGAYQIGAWRAIRELNLEDSIIAVSGTSVGGLNAALFMQGNLELAELIWKNISQDSILPLDFERCLMGNAYAFSSQNNIKELVFDALSNTNKKRKELIPCFITCKEAKTGYIKYFDISRIIDPMYKQSILLASTAIPFVYEPVLIDGLAYIDGGVNGDNTPITPLWNCGVDTIFVVHLASLNERYTEREVDPNILHIFPSHDLGGLFAGTLNFNAENVKKLYEYGYYDTKAMLHSLSSEIQQQNNSKNLKREIPNYRLTDNIRIAKTSDKTLIQKEKEDVQMETITFKGKDTQRAFDKRYEELKKIANNPEYNTEVMWNATAAKYASIIKRVQSMLSLDELRDVVPVRIEKNLQMFLKKCESPDFHIALVGAIKAGKSTLINAILGNDLASTEVTPETAALTKFRGSTRGNYVNITFYSHEEWEILWKSVKEYETSIFKKEFDALNAQPEADKWVAHSTVEIKCNSIEELAIEIKKWTSSQAPAHFFVKEVEVGLEDCKLVPSVVLVDTPGLNDAVAYRSEITKNYINRANAVFVCVKADALTGSEYATICSVFANARYNPEKIYILATQQDSLNDPVEDWKKQRLNWLQRLEESTCFGSHELAGKNLLAVSAYFYSLLKKRDKLERKQRFQLESTALRLEIAPEEIDEKYNDLIDFTAIEHLKQKMNSEIVEKYSKLLIEDLENSYQQCKEEIEELLQKTRKTQQELIATSQKSLEDIREEQEKNQAKLREAESDQQEFVELTQQLREMAQQKSAELVKAIRSLEVH
ncbi:MAG: patatin-like phospholipase family protein [Christensenellaceae bacterium]